MPLSHTDHQLSKDTQREALTGGLFGLYRHTYDLWECPPVSVNSLRLEAEVPPALTAQRGGMDPVDGQLLANLPDLGVKEEGRVNDGLLGRNPHLGVIHLRIHGLRLIHLLENTTHAHTHTHSYITWHVTACKNVHA